MWPSRAWVSCFRGAEPSATGLCLPGNRVRREQNFWFFSGRLTRTSKIVFVLKKLAVSYNKYWVGRSYVTRECMYMGMYVGSACVYVCDRRDGGRWAAECLGKIPHQVNTKRTERLTIKADPGHWGAISSSECLMPRSQSRKWER